MYAYMTSVHLRLPTVPSPDQKGRVSCTLRMARLRVRGGHATVVVRLASKPRKIQWQASKRCLAISGGLLEHAQRLLSQVQTA